jgi:hypothetical protein
MTGWTGDKSCQRYKQIQNEVSRLGKWYLYERCRYEAAGDSFELSFAKK